MAKTEREVAGASAESGMVEERRAFLKRAGKGMAAAPAVALLLAASSKPAAAQEVYGGSPPDGGGGCGCGS